MELYTLNAKLYNSYLIEKVIENCVSLSGATRWISNEITNKRMETFESFPKSKYYADPSYIHNLINHGYFYGAEERKEGWELYCRTQNLTKDDVCEINEYFRLISGNSDNEGITVDPRCFVLASEVRNAVKEETVSNITELYEMTPEEAENTYEAGVEDDFSELVYVDRDEFYTDVHNDGLDLYVTVERVRND